MQPPQESESLVAEQYAAYVGRKVAFLFALLALMAVLLVMSVSLGPVRLSLGRTLRALVAHGADRQAAAIVWSIRLPEALSAILAGAGLALAGTAMQSILRNPLGSPFTLGIAHAAAFGAALAVMVFGAGVTGGGQGAVVRVLNPYATVASAFAMSMGAGLAIIVVSRARGPSPEVMVLAGVALGSLFTAGTMALQYFADDTQLAAMVFWTFGDVGRAGWREIAVMAGLSLAAGGYFFSRRWDYNALDAGEETARGLGVAVGRVRLMGMFVATLVTAGIVAALGIIGFVGLVCPHMVRRLIGDDHRFLLPGSALAGAALLLASSIAARLVLAPHVLPVSLLTSFLGAPAFLYLIMRRRSQ